MFTTSRTGMLRTITIAIAGVAAGALSACGSSSSPTGSTQVISASTGSTGTSGATITITAAGVSPSQVSISVGQSVTFVNSDGRVHNMSSDPHPAHTDCPSINAVGTISNGQTKLTNSLPTARSCGFHDHDDPDNAQLKGSIIVQ